MPYLIVKTGAESGRIFPLEKKQTLIGRAEDSDIPVPDKNVSRHHAACHLQQAADWNRRLVDLREQEWEAAQKLNAVAQCFLETCGEDEVRRMTLAQVSRALKISSAVARSAITGAELPASSETGLSPLQQQLLAGLTRIYGSSEPAASPLAPRPSSHEPTHV